MGLVFISTVASLKFKYINPVNIKIGANPANTAFINITFSSFLSLLKYTFTFRSVKMFIIIVTMARYISNWVEWKPRFDRILNSTSYIEAMK